MTTIEIRATASCTAAEGPHARFAVWVQGCTLGCAGCCNPEMFAQGVAVHTTIDTLTSQLMRARASIEGLSILGGEPLQQLDAVTELAARAQALDLGVIVFTGYTFAQARQLAGFARLWSSIDTLVDGPFEANLLEDQRRFIGSRNQQLVHRTQRYADPSLWTGPKVVEITIDGHGTARLVGAPALVRRVQRRLQPQTR